MSKGKRTVTCGGCGETGHNTRTCPSKTVGNKTVETATATAPPPVATLPDPPKVEATPSVPPLPVPKKTKIDVRNPREREAPTADRGTAATAAPYRCTKCNQVAILAIVRVKDHVATQRNGTLTFKGEQRCELCLNKPDPAELILKWGVKPGETITEAEANPAT